MNFSTAKLKLRAQEYKLKWAEACQHQLSSETHKYIFEIAILLWKMEQMSALEGRSFAASKWHRMQTLFEKSVESVECKKMNDLLFLQITIRKIYGECSNKYSIFRRIEIDGSLPPHTQSDS